MGTANFHAASERSPSIRGAEKDAGIRAATIAFDDVPPIPNEQSNNVAANKYTKWRRYIRWEETYRKVE